MLDDDIPGKRRGRPNLWWKDACKRDMTEAGLAERGQRNKQGSTEEAIYIISYTGDPRYEEEPHHYSSTSASKLICLSIEY